MVDRTALPFGSAASPGRAGLVDSGRRQAATALLAALGLGALAGCRDDQGNPAPELGAATQALDGTGDVIWLDSIAALTATYSATDATAVVQGYSVPGDGGGGIFVWRNAASSTSPASDGGTIFQVTPPAGQPAGYWQRLHDGSLDVRWFGARGDGTHDDTAAIQQCMDAGQGQVIRLAKGLYKVTSTLHIRERCRRLVGNAGGRNADGGTEIQYLGTGPLFEIGVDNGHAWDANEYNGPQDQWLENLWLSHGAPNTNLNSQGQYATGTYGIRDWRAGGIRLRHVGIEHFEFGFWGVQSDINVFEGPTVLYCKVGIYAGPRSDQFTIKDAYTFFCDTFLRVDAGVRQLRLIDAQIVGCGSKDDYPIDIYKATGPIRIVRPWLEHYQGYAGPDQAAFIAIGLRNGYRGAPDTDDRYCQTITIEQPHAVTNVPGTQFHTKYLIDLGAAYGVKVIDPEAAVGVGFTNLDGVFHSPAGTSYSGTGCVSCSRHAFDPVGPKLHVNEGNGNPQLHADFWGWAEHGVLNSNGRITAHRIGGIPGGDSLTLSTEGVAGAVFLSTRGYPNSTNDRLLLKRAIQTASAPPTSGPWERGDILFNNSPLAGGKLGWVCITSGSPGVWKPWGMIDA